MPIDIVCGNCRKRYKVDAKLAGKRCACKACANDIYVPVFESLGDSETAPAFPPPPPPPDETPAAPPAPVYPAPVAAAGGAPHISHDPARRILSRRAVRRNSLGYRITRPYENPFLNWIEGAAVFTSQIVYWLSVAALAALSLLLFIACCRAASAGSAPAFEVWAFVMAMTPVYFVLTYYIILPIMAAGVRIASNLMLFEVPEGAAWRALAAYQISWLVGIMVFLMIGLGSAVFAAGVRNPAMNGIIGLTGIALYIGIIIPVHFFLTKTFFRLHFMETVIAYVFQFMVMLAINAASLALTLVIRIFNN